MSNIKDLIYKKIGILGFSTNNRAITKWLVKHGAKDLTVLDEGQIQIDPILKVKNWQIGKNAFNNLNQFNLIIRSPGIPLHHPKLIEAKKFGVEISSQTKLFFKFCPAKIIGITGTYGKGTTALLLKKILQADKKLSGKVYLAGNIGKDPFEFIDNLTNDDWVVLELSSFQLQDLKKSPHIAVVLKTTVEHLDHHLDENEYISAKLPIIKYQTNKDFTVINADFKHKKLFEMAAKSQIYHNSRQKSVDRGVFVENDKVVCRDHLSQETELFLTSDVKLKGEHNLENITAAITAARLVGVDFKTIKTVCTEFTGYEHRLQLVGEISGIEFWDDSIATTPERAIAAIKSFTEPVHLIVGGASKKLDFSELGRIIAQESSVKTIIPLGEAEATKIVTAIESSRTHKNPIILPIVFNMKSAVKSAFKNAKKKDVILLSPAATGFDLFKNYADRGNQFIAEVKKLEGKNVS